MAAGSVRRGGGSSVYQQTYTLGPQERLRLDAVSWMTDYAYDGVALNPTLRVATAGGATIAEIAATQEDILGPPGFGDFDYSGPAAFSDDDQIQPPHGYFGYGLHDFGAALTQTQITIDNSSTRTRPTAESFTWLRSAGAVTMGFSIGDASDVNTDTLTVTLASPIAAGHYLLIALAYLDQASAPSADFQPLPTVTDTVGGNLLDYSGLNAFAFSYEQLSVGTGLYLHGGGLFYRIVTPLGVGARVTVTLNNADPLWFGLHVHDVAGLTVGNPIGPNPGGNEIGLGVPSPTLPHTTVGLPVPIWTGGVFFSGLYNVPAPNTVAVTMSRGQTFFAQPLSGVLSPGSDFTQMALPELHLLPRDTVTVLALDADGTPRVADTIHDFLLWGVDE